MALRDQVGRLLEQLRGDASRADVAAMLGVSRPYMHSIESGSISFDKLDEIAAEYGVEFRLIAVRPGSVAAASRYGVAGQAPAVRQRLGAVPRTASAAP